MKIYRIRHKQKKGKNFAGKYFRNKINRNENEQKVNYVIRIKWLCVEHFCEKHGHSYLVYVSVCNNLVIKRFFSYN